jgi:DNA-binding transcriptional MerR regulator
MAFTVGELSRLTGVTVRALHHYDEIGLVQPSGRSAAGYRLYDADDVVRLQRVLVLRSLGVALADIGPALAAAATDQAALLRQHRDALLAQRDQLDHQLVAVERALEALAHDGQPGQKDRLTMSGSDLQHMFDGFNPADHEAEVKQRWGNTEAYKESARRIPNYGEQEWQEIRQEADAIYARLRLLMQQKAAPGDPAVQAEVEAHRKHIDRWFYPCPKAMHHGLGEMYVADERFAANLDKVVAGFAQFLRDAIAAS